jgi:tetratricopeptide (TPR) repeat protein
MTRLLTALALAAALCAASTAQPPAPAPSAGEAKAKELFNTGKFDDALKELQAAAKADPKQPPPKVTMAAWFYEARQGQAARQLVEAAAAEDPTHPSVYLLNASFAFGEGRLTDTILSAKVVLELASNPRWNPEQRSRFLREARTALARSFEARQDWSAARDYLTAILQDDPKYGPARQRLAAVVFRLGKPDDAFAELQRAYKDDPASALPELQMADLYAAANDDAKAEEWFKKAVAAYPKDAKPARGYSIWLLNAGKADAARQYMEEAVKLDRAGEDTLKLQGLMARYRKDYAEAEKIFEALHQKHPNDAFATWNLALALAESGDKGKQQRAAEVAEAEVRRNQQAPEGYAVLAWCYHKAGRPDEAEKAVAPLLQTGAMPSRDAAYFVAKVLADKGKFEAAFIALKAADQARGVYVYRADAQKLLAEVEKKVPKKDEKK